MPLDRQPRVVRLHPLAIVFDANQLLAPLLDRDADPARARVEGILDEFLDHGRGSFDDLTCRNLVREIWRKPVNFSHDP